MCRSSSTHDHSYVPGRTRRRIPASDGMRRRCGGGDGPRVRLRSCSRRPVLTLALVGGVRRGGSPATAGRGTQDAGPNTGRHRAGRPGDRPGQGLAPLHPRPVRAHRRRLAADRELGRAQRAQGLVGPPHGRRPALTDRRLRPHRRGRTAQEPRRQAALQPVLGLRLARHRLRGRTPRRVLRLRDRHQLQPAARHFTLDWTRPSAPHEAAASGSTSTTAAPPTAASASPRTT